MRTLLHLFHFIHFIPGLSSSATQARWFQNTVKPLFFKLPRETKIHLGKSTETNSLRKQGKNNRLRRGKLIWFELLGVKKKKV